MKSILIIIDCLYITEFKLTVRQFKKDKLKLSWHDRKSLSHSRVARLQYINDEDLFLIGRRFGEILTIKNNKR